MVGERAVGLPAIFISYTQVDRAWAEWIAWQLEETGYDVRLQAWHSAPGSNWAAWMHRMANEADHTLVVLSPDALRSDYVEAEWQAAFRDDPLGRRRRVIPVRVAPCERPGLLGGYTWIDMVGLPVEQARMELLNGVWAAHTAGTAGGRPGQAPPFPGKPVPAAQAPAFPGEQYRSVTTRFLDLVEQACADSYPDARIQRVSEDDPAAAHLFVTRDESGFTRRWPIGIAPDGLDESVFTVFVERVHARYEARDPEVESELVYGGEVVDAMLVRRARRRGVLIRSLPEFQRLWDPRRYLIRQAERLESDLLYPPWLYVSQRYVRLDRADRHNPDQPAEPDEPDDDVFDAMVNWLDAESARLILVLANFGHGKTFLLRELARRLPRILPNLVPVFIELRALEKNHSLDALLAQHLAVAGEEHIDIPAVRRMLERGQVVLLFDGFDELALQVTYDRAAEHLRTILSAVQGRAKIVLSSRTQHFASDDQWRTELGDEVHLVAGSRLVLLEDFADSQIRDFLVRLYRGDTAAADARLELIRDIKDLLGLSRNPRMLSFIAALDEAELRAVRASGGGISSADLYEKLIDRWLRFEVNRRRPTLGAVPGLNVDQIRRAVTALALHLWRSAQGDVELSRLEETTRLTLADLALDRLDPAQAAYAIGSGSLLVRGDEDRFGFVHISVMEYLVALEAASLLRNGRPADGLLAGREMSPLMADFFCGAAGQREAEAWTRAVNDDTAATDAARANALQVTRRLRVRGIRMRLAGRDLRGQDLSGLDLRFADLTGADLRGVRLRDADLTGANLTGARLGDAVLDTVMLDRADLRGADLTGARLIRVTMHNTAIETSTWCRAALLGSGSTVDEQILAAPELSGVAVAGRDPVEIMVRPPGGQIRAVAFSPWATLLAAAAGPIIMIIEPQAGHTVRTLTGHAGDVRSVAFSPDGTILASGSADATIRIWDTDTGAVRAVLLVDAGEVRSVAFSPDGTLLACGNADGTIRLWNTSARTPATGAPTLLVQAHTGRVGSVAFSPDGSLLASGGADQMVRLWDVSTGEVRHAMAGHTGWVESVAFSPDGSLLATGGFKQIRLWDVASGEQTDTLSGHDGGVWSVAFSPDGSLLASGGADEAVRTWRLSTNRPGSLAGHSARVWSVAFSPDGTLLASGGADWTVRIVEAATSRRLHTITGSAGHTGSVAFSPDGTMLATGAGPTVRLREVVSGNQIGSLTGHAGTVGPVAFNPDGSLLAAGDADPRGERTIGLWDIATGGRRAVLPGHQGGLVATVFSPDGALLASRDGQGRVRLWNVASGTLRSSLPDCPGSGPVAFSPDGVLLAVTAGSCVQLWNVTAGREATRLPDPPDHDAAVRALAFSPDGGLLATADRARIHLWDVASTERTGLINPDPPAASGVTDPAAVRGAVLSMAFSPDGAILASACDDGSVRLYEPATGRTSAQLTGHVGAVHTVTFSPDGRLLASAGADGSTRLWEVRSGELLATMMNPSAHGWCLVLPDGGYKLVGDLAGAFSWVIRECVFGPGELDGFLPGVRKLGDSDPIPRLDGYPAVSRTILGIPLETRRGPAADAPRPSERDRRRRWRPGHR